MAHQYPAKPEPVRPAPDLAYENHNMARRLSAASQSYLAEKYEYELRINNNTTVRHIDQMLRHLPNNPYSPRVSESFWRSRPEEREDIERRVLGKPRIIRRKKGSYGSRMSRGDSHINSSSSQTANSTLKKSGVRLVKHSQNVRSKPSTRARSSDGISDADSDIDATINPTGDDTRHAAASSSPPQYAERDGVIIIDESDDDMGGIQTTPQSPPHHSPTSPTSSPRPRITEEQARYAAALMFSTEKFAGRMPDAELRAEWYKLIWQEMSEEYSDVGLDAAGWAAAFTNFKEQFEEELKHMREVGMEVTFGSAPDPSDELA